jgi:hypothetical protein
MLAPSNCRDQKVGAAYQLRVNTLRIAHLGTEERANCQAHLAGVKWPPSNDPSRRLKATREPASKAAPPIRRAVPRAHPKTTAAGPPKRSSAHLESPNPPRSRPNEKRGETTGHPPPPPAASRHFQPPEPSPTSDRPPRRRASRSEHHSGFGWSQPATGADRRGTRCPHQEHTRTPPAPLRWTASARSHRLEAAPTRP